MYRSPYVWLILLVFVAVGCEDLFPSRENDEPIPDDGAVTDVDEPIDFAQVIWLHTDVSGWARTATLNASVSGSSMIMDYDKAKVWPAKDGANANPWIFVFQNSQWYAATWEWMRPGQTVKAKSAVHGSHIKIGALKNFSPKSGETYGFMVSGLARDGRRTVLERSNVDMVVWP